MSKSDSDSDSDSENETWDGPMTEEEILAALEKNEAERDAKIGNFLSYMIH